MQNDISFLGREIRFTQDLKDSANSKTSELVEERFGVYYEEIHFIPR